MKRKKRNIRDKHRNWKVFYKKPVPANKANATYLRNSVYCFE